MSGKSVLVIGGGGREHALCIGLSQSNLVAQIHCTPGNAGIADVARIHSVSADDVAGIVELSGNVGADFVVVGPEAPLCLGLSDALSEKGIPCFGPCESHAQLEGSKLYAKQVMQSIGVPTAKFRKIRTTGEAEDALDAFDGKPWVIKRDVLAGGKGVVVSENRDEVMTFIESSIITDGYVLIEEFLPGEEASLLVIMDAEEFVCLPASQDHKREFNGDKGRNTGGMGAYAPAPVFDKSVESKAIENIVKPMHQWLSNQPIPYRGVLYVGLMIDESGDPFVVEFNVRFGDPECQVTIPLIASDLGELLWSASTDCLQKYDLEIHNSAALTVVLASEGYPGTPITDREIIGLEEIHHGILHHAATAKKSGQIQSTGGRVLACTGLGDDLSAARKQAYEMIYSIELEGSRFREDIGHRAL